MDFCVPALELADAVGFRGLITVYNVRVALALHIGLLHIS